MNQKKISFFAIYVPLTFKIRFNCKTSNKQRAKNKQKKKKLIKDI